MTDRDTNPTCDSIRPLLFLAIEGEIDDRQRLDVHAHLAICERCRSWESGERALTALLTESAKRLEATTRGSGHGARARFYSLAAAALAAALILFLLPAAAPRGSVTQRQLGPDRGWTVAAERAIVGRDVIEVPARAAATVELGDDIRLEAVGPAGFALTSDDDGWHVAVLDGSVLAIITGKGKLSTAGTAALGAGHWRLEPNAVSREQPLPAQEPQPQTPAPRPGAARHGAADLVARGISRFAQVGFTLPGQLREADRAHLLAARELLENALATATADTDAEREALFYMACTLGRLGRDEESFAFEKRYLERFPDGDEATLVRHYMACHLLNVGRRDEARAMFRRVIEDEGMTSVGAASAGYLERMDREDAEAEDEASRPGGEKSGRPTRAKSSNGAPDTGPYLVVPVDLAPGRASDAGFLRVATSAQRFHRAASWSWDGRDFEALQRELRRRAPANVAFVLRPDTLDLPLHRRILLLAAALDDDWFCDVAFGYLTAEDGAACERLWQRIERVHASGKREGTWLQASVAPMERSLLYADSPPQAVGAAGYVAPHYYYGTKDPDCDAFVTRSLAAMSTAAVVEFTGCGDPQGIWLFDDERNLKPELHWNYDPARVGEDPSGEMPRLMAARFRELELDAPILWSGTCHSGAVQRVFVEGDIVSTFGRTENATVHELRPENSLALSWLAAGAVSLLVPLGANHGMSVAMETDFALRHGASLGETMKSTYDDVLLAANGELVLDIPEVGKPHKRGEAVMQGGGSNRILIGDPALRPFPRVESPAEKVRAIRTDDGLTVTIEREAGWQPRSWDMFGTDRRADYRVLTRIDLTALGIAADRFDARVVAHAADGRPMNYRLRRCAVERHDGRQFLHLQANGTRQELDRKAATIVFEVRAGG